MLDGELVVCMCYNEKYISGSNLMLDECLKAMLFEWIKKPKICTVLTNESLINFTKNFNASCMLLDMHGGSTPTNVKLFIVNLSNIIKC